MPHTPSNWRATLYRFYEERLAKRSTYQYFDLLDAMQWKSEEEIRAFQWSELQKLLRHAYANVPFHRRRFDALGITPEAIRTPEEYARLPLLDKHDLIDHQDDLVSANADRSRLFTKRSSGSTGVSAVYQYDHDSYEWRQAAHLRGNLWAGAAVGRREYHLWGLPLKPLPPLKAWKKRAYNGIMNRYFADTYDPAPEAMGRFMDEYNRLRPEIVIAYSSSLFTFAKHAKRRGTRLWSPHSLITTAEKLTPSQRALVEEVFQAPVFDRYGCREVMMIGMECEQHHGMHLTLDNLYVEFLREDGSPAHPGELGEVVLTDLHNYAMPLLRYRVGDLAIPSDRKCPCGRGLPMMEEVRGRTQELLLTPDGRQVSGLLIEEILEAPVWVDEYQVEQTALDRVEVRIKPCGEFRPDEMDEVTRDLQAWFGPEVRLEVGTVENIPRSASGKHRPIISRVRQEDLVAS